MSHSFSGLSDWNSDIIAYMSLIKKKSYLQTFKVYLKQHFNPQIESLLTNYFKHEQGTNSRWGYTEI